MKTPKTIMDADTLLKELVAVAEQVDFMAEAYPEAAELLQQLRVATNESEIKRIKSELKSYPLTERQKYVIVVEKLIALAEMFDCGLCKNKAFCYIFNGAYWVEIEKERLENFLGEIAERMGIPRLDARQYTVREQLIRQFFATGFLPAPKSNDEIKINLTNGTFYIKGKERGLREYNRADFLRYMLPFDYNPEATAKQFEAFLNRVLPDLNCQKVLAEYIGWLFLTNFKYEKALILYGGGANGKSVFFDIISALLGKENISNFTMGNLCDDSGYYRAKLVNKLLNYSSEIGGGKTNADTMKQLISGEAISCRLPYGEPFTLDSGYARLMFNANTLPKDTEQTNAFFRRFIIVPFSVTIPEEEQDKFLAQKIIQSELSGIFNWVLDGLDRLIMNEGFTQSELISGALSEYRKQSDTVQMFLDDEGYKPIDNARVPLKDIFTEYKSYCSENNYRAVGNKTFADRCRTIGYTVDRGSAGTQVWAEKVAASEPASPLPF